MAKLATGVFLLKGLTPLKLWVGVFGLWTVFLSGAMASFVDSPGVIQSMRLKSFLESKQKLLHQIEEEVKHIEAENVRLERSRVAQEREVRRTLGYAASDELIFDFAAAERQEGPAP